MSENERAQLSDIADNPKFIDDGNVGDLMVRMGTYYEQADYLYDSRTAKTVITLPYFDYDGLGVVLTAAAPVFRNVGNFKNVTAVASEQERYIGVVGIDVAVADIFQDLVDSSQHGKRSFALLVDFKGRALYHPSLPSPEQNTGNQPQFVDIRELLMIQSCSGGISS